MAHGGLCDPQLIRTASMLAHNGVSDKETGKAEK